jgi:hypothetical protein
VLVQENFHYRESDGQILFNENSLGLAHTSLAPICKVSKCVPQCLENGKWTMALPTCEKDWCNPVHKEWSCCQERQAEMGQDYWLKHHGQTTGRCPIGYGDCNHDIDCVAENGVDVVCAQKRDVDNIDLCIVDADPCITEEGVANAMCCVFEAVGVSYHDKSSSGVAKRTFLAGSFLALGTILGYYLTRKTKTEEHMWLLEEATS